MATQYCAETGAELEIRGTGEYPFIHLDGLGGVYFANDTARDDWCQRNVRWENGRWVPQQPGQVTINGQTVPVMT